MRWRLRSAVESGIQAINAFRADAVGEIRLRVAADVAFNRGPSPVGVANLLTGGTDRQKAAKGLDLAESLLQRRDQRLSFPLGLLARADIAEVDHQTTGARSVDI